MEKSPSLTSLSPETSRRVTRMRQARAGPRTVHGSIPSFGVSAKSVSQLTPPSRESSIRTFPSPGALHVIKRSLPPSHVSPPFGFVTVIPTIVSAIVKSAALSAVIVGSSRSVRRSRQCADGGPSTSHTCTSSFRTFEKMLSKVRPLSRESSMRTLPRVAPDQTMSRLAPTGQTSPPLGVRMLSGVWAWATPAKTASAATT